jgi:hypothetical protein
MRKSIKIVPVFGPEQDETKDQPIDHIAHGDAAFLIRDGRAHSLKGRAIRLLPLRPRSSASARPDHHVIERYAAAKSSGADPELVAAVDEIGSCPTRTEMLNAEAHLRNRAKFATDQKRAARLADKAIVLQRQRFAHEAACKTCARIEGPR